MKINGSKVSPEATPLTSGTAPEAAHTGRNRQRRVGVRNPVRFLRQVWGRLTSGPALSKRRVTHTPAPQQGYQIFRPVGFGVTGQVNLSYETQEHQPGSALLAKKSYLIRSDSAEKDTEYQMLRALDHPNIAQLKDARINHEPPQNGEPRTRITLYTESGVTSLARALQNEPPLKASARDVAHIMGGLTDGMTYLHNRQVTHNDLKPGNLVVMPDMTIKLIDFGSAVDFSPGSPLNDGGNPNHGAIGSPGYRSPEIELRDDRCGFDFEALRKGDYWAAGTILFELLTAAPLCPGEDTGKLQNPEYVNHKLDAIPDDIGSSIKGWTNEDIAAVKAALRGLLDPDPAQRSLTELNAFIARHS